jgi:hypothetical protein
MRTDSMQDRTAIEVEISRLRRIEAKVDTSMRESVVRRIRELQVQLHGCPSTSGSTTDDFRQ